MGVPTQSFTEEDGPLVQRLLEERDSWKPYGNHKVFCGGGMVIGPVRSWCWLLQIHTILVTFVFLLERDKYSFNIVPIGGAVLFLACFLSSWKVLLWSPGIVKRLSFEQALINARRVERCIRAGKPYPTETKQVKGQPERWVYCFECQVHRPPKSGHCSICDCCIEQLDHHCPIVGVCISKDNQLAFYAMILSLTLLHSFLLMASLTVAIEMSASNNAHGNPPWWSASWTLNLTIIGGLFCFILAYVSINCGSNRYPPHRRAISRLMYSPLMPGAGTLSAKDSNEESQWTTCDTDESDNNANP